MIAQALRIHETSVIRYINDYLKKEKLLPENGGSLSQLNEEQTQQLIAHLIEHTYPDTGGPHQIDIIFYIKQIGSIEFSVPGINKWFHKNGFSYKKPKNMPYKVDLDKQEEFKKSDEELKFNLVKDESTYFMDTVHPTQATKIGSGDEILIDYGPSYWEAKEHNGSYI